MSLADYSSRCCCCCYCCCCIAISRNPVFDIPVANVTVVEGQTALLPCSIEHLGKYKVRLYCCCISCLAICFLCRVYLLIAATEIIAYHTHTKYASVSQHRSTYTGNNCFMHSCGVNKKL